MGVALGPEPLAREARLGRAAERRAQHRHGVALDVEGREAEGRAPGVAHQVPVHEGEVEAGRVGHEHRPQAPPGDGLALQLRQPGHVLAQRRLGRLRVEARGLPGRRVVAPEGQGLGRSGSAGQRLQVAAETARLPEPDRARPGLVHLEHEGHGGERQHRVRSRDRPVGLDVGADVELGPHPQPSPRRWRSYLPFCTAWHQAAWSRYQRTVRRRPLSKSWRGAQPSSRRTLEASMA